MRIDINYDKKNSQAKSSKGPVMRIANTFVQCFTFALRQMLLIFLFVYVFACLFQCVLWWVPCTTFGDFVGTERTLKEAYSGNCEENHLGESIDEKLKPIPAALIKFVSTHSSQISAILAYLWCLKTLAARYALL